MKTIRRIILDPKKVWSVLFKKTGEYKLNDDVLVKLENEGLCVYFSEPILDKQECHCSCHALNNFGWDQKTRKCDHCEPQQKQIKELENTITMSDASVEFSISMQNRKKINELCIAVNKLLRERE